MSSLSRWKTRAATVAALSALFAASAAPMAAQSTGTIRGTVVSAGALRPLSGAQVSVSGTGLGTLTNSSGQFIIVGVPAGEHAVRVQMIGFGTEQETIRVSAGETATARFELSESAIALDEVVVTGTAAAARKREVGNSIASISSQEIQTAPVSNSQDILAGRALGVTVMANSGQPGAGGTVKIRGVNTITQSGNPIIYVDGIRINSEPTRNGWAGRTMSSPLQDIPAEDIERIEIVKGAAATTLYGTEASAGVIQIFTKKGIAGAPIWNMEVSGGLSSPVHWGASGDPTNLFVDCRNTDLMYGLDFSTAERVYFQDPTCPESGSWDRNAGLQSYNLSVRGGSENVTYFVSGNYSDTDGILPTSNSRDGGLRGNFTFSPSEPLQVQFNSSYVRRETRWVGDGNNSNGFLLNVGRGYRGYYKGGVDDVAEKCAALPADVVCVTNSYMFELEPLTKVDHFVTGLMVNYAPTEALSNRLAIGWDFSTISNPYFTPFGSMRYPLGRYWDENTRHTKLSLDYAGSFQSRINESFASTFSWGGQIFRDSHRWSEIDVEDFAGPGVPTLESGAVTYLRDRPVDEASAGFFLQEMVGWKDRLFVTAGMRVDGNSAFGEDFGLQTYPKVSGSYVISEHDFWPTHLVDQFKLRMAVGESGRAPGAFDRYRTWRPVLGDDGKPGFTPNDVGNSSIGPERTREIEAGFDASILDGRIGLEATAYRADTYDALVPVSLPPSEGFLSSRMENAGHLRSEGLEFGIHAGLLSTRTFEWDARTNFSFLRSEAIDVDGQEIYTGLKSWVREGFPVPTYFGRVITNPDEIADPVIVRDTAIGQVFPTRNMGFGTTLTFLRNLTIDALAEYQGGHYLPNYTGFQNARRGVWYPCYDVQEQMLAGDFSGITALQRAQCAADGKSHHSDFWVEKADFVKLRHITLSYELPQRMMPFTNTATLSLAGRNLFTLSDYNGSDPEVQDATDQFNLVGNSGRFGRRDYYQIPPPRMFTASVRVSF
jgi:TonB-linked SusC/RagA family outer membrane protein